MSSQDSSQSLLSQSALSGRGLDPIRASKTQVRERKVTCWTPVLIGTANFPQHVAKVVHSYKTGDSLHEQVAFKLPDTL